MNRIIKRIIIESWNSIRLTSKPQPIFILSHMRSGSSLLMHILSSNPEIAGWGERNFTYENQKSIVNLELSIRWDKKQFLKPYRYIIDQINHNKFIPNLEILGDRNLKVIFLIRSPLESIHSHIKMSKDFYTRISEDEAVSYYQDRLDVLQSYAGFVKPKNAFFILHEELIHDTPKICKQLMDFLDLKSELNENYIIQKYTGKKGDPSENIKTGSVNRKKNKPPKKLRNDLQHEVEKAYKLCNEKLSPFRRD